MGCLKGYAYQRALRVAMVVLLSFIANYYLSFSGEGWIVLTAFLVNQTTKGTSFRQGLMIFTSMLLALVMTSLAMMYITQQEMIFVVIALIFIVCGSLLFIYQLRSANQAYYIISFFLTCVMMSGLSHASAELLQLRFFDMLIGAAIGLLCQQCFFPIRAVAEFRDDILPVLKSLRAFSQRFTENSLQQPCEFPWLISPYPEWVYESGFNPGLRAGFRYFLVYLERVADILYSMSYLFAQEMDESLMAEIHADMVCAMQKNTDLLQILIDYFASQKLNAVQSDFTSDIKQLEVTLQTITPLNLEMLETSAPYMMLTALVRDIKTMRELLLQLLMALPDHRNKN